MFTFEDRIQYVDISDLLRVLNTNKEYIVFDISVYNVGSVIRVICTDDYDKYSNISEDGYSFIFSLYDEEIFSIINVLVNRYESLIQTFTREQSYYTWDDYLKNNKLSVYNFNRLRSIYNKHCNDNYITKLIF